ncbi:uncharacterized protein LOC117123569 [Anneissia japonica]|uniref:uncharacterized protein LOC117123569 n=1 Tax=Anneissia japonica TaxID=1529436 RepID=UPI0014258129|nr:uncharacterized protein LOC117123569 [Anneissia japonica]
MDTEALQTKFIKEHFNFVDYKEITIGTKFVRKKKGAKRVICEKAESFFYIPIIESLQQLLLNDRISAMVLKKPNMHKSGVFYDMHDGSIYQRDNFFDEDRKSFLIILYHDELEVCNPLGSKAGTHKLDLYYYTIGNISPKFRSKRCAVRLLAIANAKLVKKYGINCIMRPIIEDLQLLYNGRTMLINGVNQKIYGKVLMCAGDTLGQHYLGGFKEGVGVAFQKCRHCMCEFDEMQSNFVEESFRLRTRQNYNRQCSEIEQASTKFVKKDLQTSYGINVRSALCELPTFDVTKQLPQDIMHTLLEGTVQYEVRFVLLHFIQSGSITLNQINGAIANHAYGYSEVSDKPGPLKESVFFGIDRFGIQSSPGSFISTFVAFYYWTFSRQKQSSLYLSY